MRPRCMGTSPGPGTAELLWQKPRMANAVRTQGVREGTYSKYENMHSFLFTPLLHPLLSLPLLLHVQMWSIYQKACRHVEGGGALCGPGSCPRLRRVQQREKAAYVLRMERNPLSFPNRYILSSMLFQQQIEVISVMRSFTASDVSVTTALSSDEEEKG